MVTPQIMHPAAFSCDPQVPDTRRALERRRVRRRGRRRPRRARGLRPGSAARRSARPPRRTPRLRPSISGTASTVSRLLLNVLKSDDPRQTSEFLAAHPSVLQGLFGASWRKIRRNVEIAGTTIDLCIGSFQPTRSAWVWQGIALVPVSQSPVDASGAVVPLIRDLAAARSRIAQPPVPFQRKPLPDFRPSAFRLTVLAGRRHALTRQQAEAVGEFNDLHSGIRVRSYDWLIGTAASLT